MRARDIKKALRYPEKIKRLNLRSSRPRLTGIPTSIFAFGNLEHLDLSRNNIKVVNPALFRAFPRLKSLNLDKNPELKFSGFDNFSYHGLKSLKISGCGLTEFPEFIVKLYQLENLELAGNKISEIPVSHLLSLKSIDISSTSIKTIPDDWVTWVSLNNYECRNRPSLRKKLKIIDRFRNDFNRLSVDRDQRLKLFGFFHNKQGNEAQLTYYDLLTAANSSFPEVRFAALEIVEKRYFLKSSGTGINEGSKVLFTGKVVFEKMLKTHLTEFGITIETTDHEGLTHLVIGEYPFNKIRLKNRNHPEILTGRVLFQQIHNNDDAHDNDRSLLLKINDLINSPIPANQRLGIRLLRPRKVTNPLLTDLFLLWNKTRSNDMRSALNEILEMNGGPGMPLYLSTHNPWSFGQRKKLSLKTCKRLGLDIARLRAAGVI